ncbi:MAG: hypothetical protein J6328_03755 [Bacilli bacterium]|nr:hypothetical protein [Bacilli bacterium]
MEFGVGGEGLEGVKAYVSELGKTYRLALLDLGRSPDSHIYDLGEQDFYLADAESRSYRFLKSLSAFYHSLPFLEGEIFVKECLEKGRHYRYWYLGGSNVKIYRRSKRALFEKMKEAF